MRDRLEAGLLAGDLLAQLAERREVAKRHERSVTDPPPPGAGTARREPEDDRVARAHRLPPGTEVTAQSDAPAIACALEDDFGGEVARRSCVERANDRDRDGDSGRVVAGGGPELRRRELDQPR